MGHACDIAVVGLAVMGQNLVLNMNDHGYSVAVYNRTSAKKDEFLAGPAKGRDTITGADTLEELVSMLKRPRKIMLMVKAGAVVDSFIDQLLPFLEPGDIIIDGGNSHYDDTTRRTEQLKGQGIGFIGTGISGGEEGARRGPSIMPGGDPEAWPEVKEIFRAIAARTEDDEICCDWVGPQGAGHYVKMVHNGIEYGDMQIIAEAYHFLKEVIGLSQEELQRTFSEWNEGELDSYLIEITSAIMAARDTDGSPLLERILDTAGQKGTGKWTGISSLESGTPVTLITEAVFARALSYLKEERTHASSLLRGPESGLLLEEEREAWIEKVRQALFASKIISYAQGYMLLRQKAEAEHWDLDYGNIALMWRGGCIIRSAFLGRIKEAYDSDPALKNLLLSPYFAERIDASQDSWRAVVARAALSGVPMPATSSALSFYDGYRSARLPANLIQAQRDFFGAHTYERVDRDRGEFFHTDWTGSGGDVTSGTYEV